MELLSLIFIGHSGVGKTNLTISLEYFGIKSRIKTEFIYNN